METGDRRLEMDEVADRVCACAVCFSSRQGS